MRNFIYSESSINANYQRQWILTRLPYACGFKMTFITGYYVMHLKIYNFICKIGGKQNITALNLNRETSYAIRVTKSSCFPSFINTISL